jgi:hypothetical protein
MAKLGRPPSKFCPRGHDMSVHRTVQSGRPWCRVCKNMRWKSFRYGLTVEQLDALAASQDERCAICRKRWNTENTREPCVDHDHENGAVRALLCRKCNIAIGHMDDDAARMRIAADYIEKHYVKKAPAA